MSEDMVCARYNVVLLPEERAETFTKKRGAISRVVRRLRARIKVCIDVRYVLRWF